MEHSHTGDMASFALPPEPGPAPGGPSASAPGTPLVVCIDLEPLRSAHVRNIKCGTIKQTVQPEEERKESHDCCISWRYRDQLVQ